MGKATKPFIYDEKLTAEEMAAKAGLTVKQVRNRLQRLGFNHRQNKTELNFKKVKQYFEENPGATVSQASHDLEMSRPTIIKFRAMGDEYVPAHKRKTYRCLSVGSDVNKVLRGIISLHLPQSTTFDCDLTFGEGGFYRKGIPIPQHIYDLFNYGEKSPAGSDVRKLDLKNPADIKVNSVMIDLPVEISKEDFTSATELYEAYEAYIEYANFILNKGGVLVFSTADFILWDDNDNTWATDFAISVALELGFSLKDKIHLVRKGGNITVNGVTVKSGLKDSAFLIFTKN